MKKLLIFLLLLLVGCTSQPISGTVTRKRIEPEQTDIYVFSTGDGGIMTYPITTPQAYQLQISADGCSRWIYVSESQFDSAQIGDEWQP